MRDKLRRDIDAHVASVHAAKLSELTSSFEVQFFYDYPFVLLCVPASFSNCLQVKIS